MFSGFAVATRIWIMTYEGIDEGTYRLVGSLAVGLAAAVACGRFHASAAFRRPFGCGQRFHGERVHWAREFICKKGVHMLVALNPAQVVKDGRHYDHFEMRFGAGWHVVHVAFVNYIEVFGRQGCTNFAFDFGLHGQGLCSHFPI